MSDKEEAGQSNREMDKDNSEKANDEKVPESPEINVVVEVTNAKASDQTPKQPKAPSNWWLKPEKKEIQEKENQENQVSSTSDENKNQQNGATKKTLSPRKQTSPRKPASPRQDLLAHIKQQKSLLSKMGEEASAPPPLADPFKKTEDMVGIFHNRRGTGYSYSPSREHHNPWDESHPERVERCYGIDNMIVDFDAYIATMGPKQVLQGEKEILAAIRLVHPLPHQTALGKIPNRDEDSHEMPYLSFLCDLFQQEETAAMMFDSVYFNGPESLMCALHTARMGITLTRKVISGELSNGFANIRPPGHHAHEEPNGYCLLNNIAIAAMDLLRNDLAERVLIVDFDVHHGQGTQRVFYNDDRVLYFSVHRYQHGTFWPNLEESNFDYIGEGKGKGFNINVPLNETGLTDLDYILIIINLLLPVAYEFNPSIVLVSAGYDCMIGCPEGKMNATPAMYFHLTSLLKGLAGGKVVVFLEGGYFIPSLVEGARKTIQALVNHVPPKLDHSHSHARSVVDTINDVKIALRPYWNCFKMDPVADVANILTYDRHNYHVAIPVFNGVPEEGPPYPYIHEYPSLNPTEYQYFAKKVELFKENFLYTDLHIKVGFIENRWSKHHEPPENFRTQEVPKRMTAIKKALEKHDLISRMIPVNAESLPSLHKPDQIAKHNMASNQTKMMLYKIHSKEYLKKLKTWEDLELNRPDFYVTPKKSYKVCQQSCSNLTQLISDIAKRKYRHGVAIMRPPGHHAKREAGGGFCLINHVAIAAHYAVDWTCLGRVLIVDFDVHHGNGTQELTYDSSDIMYISIHRFDNRNFFPNEPTGNYTYVGEGKAAGRNMNIAFNNAKMGNSDYLFTWFKAVLPVAYSMAPDLILISAGFDACVHDPLGGYNVHPEVFGHMVSTIKNVAPVILSLEGGYHCEGSALCMVNCVRALLGEPLPMPDLGEVHKEAAEAVYKTCAVMRPFWPVLDTCKKLDKNVRTVKDLEEAVKNAEQDRSELAF